MGRGTEKVSPLNCEAPWTWNFGAGTQGHVWNQGPRLRPRLRYVGWKRSAQ